MKIFLDANVLVSVLNKEYPLFTYSSRIVSLAGASGFEVYTIRRRFALPLLFILPKRNTKRNWPNKR